MTEDICESCQGTTTNSTGDGDCGACYGTGSAETSLETDSDKIINERYVVSNLAVSYVGDQLYVALVEFQLKEQLRNLRNGIDATVSVLRQRLWKEANEDETTYCGEQRVRIWSNA